MTVPPVTVYGVLFTIINTRQISMLTLPTYSFCSTGCIITISFWVYVHKCQTETRSFDFEMSNP